MRLSIADLQNLAASVGFPQGTIATAAAVAMAESGGDPNAVGDPTFGGSYGLWQINAPSHPQYDTQRLLDPTYNAEAALAISNGGTNWKPWSTFNSDAYQAYVTAYVAPARSWLIALGIVTIAGAAAYGIEAGWFDDLLLKKRRRARRLTY